MFLERSYTAYKMYVNGSILMQNGIIGTNRETIIPQELPTSTALPADDTIIISWKIANYHYINGGPQKTPKIGMNKQIRSSLWKDDLQRDQT